MNDKTEPTSPQPHAWERDMVTWEICQSPEGPTARIIFKSEGACRDFLLQVILGQPK